MTVSAHRRRRKAFRSEDRLAGYGMKAMFMTYLRIMNDGWRWRYEAMMVYWAWDRPSSVHV
jgi:hypothetical protein